ncbi:MAG TPA: large-conductance mechanosensitive channel protein MscL [Thiotrichaceae bacterium]|nr:large-conductance mechanosensitive channel protein MscL [Thiotrichaceae bacterium]
MGIIKEFKEFAMKGNMMDMATGIIIGGAVGKLVTSLVDNVVMPPIGLLMGGVDFSDMGLVLKAASGDAPALIWKYGAFIQSLIDFIIIAFAIFMLIKLMNKLRSAPEKEEKGPTTEEILVEIRDELRKK